MGKRIATLHAEISADSTKLQKGLADSKAGLARTKADMQKLADQTTRLGGDFRQTGNIIDDWVGTLRASTPENAKYAASVDKITKEFQDGKISAQEAADKLEAVKREMDEANQSAKNLKGGLTGVKDKFDSFKSSLLPAAAILTGFGLGLKKTWNIAKEAAGMDYAIQKFDRLAASVGTTSAALLNDLQKATKGTRSEIELMTSAGDLMALGLAKSKDEVIRLSTVAGQLGMDMNQLVLTLTNQTTMRFDALGVSVDGFDAKVDALKKTGMDANAAFKEAFLQQAEEQVRKLGDKATTTAGKFAQFEVQVIDLGNAFKLKLLPAAEDVLTALDVIVFGKGKIISTLAAHEEEVRKTAKSYEEYATEINRAAKAARYHIDENGLLRNGLNKTQEGFYFLSEAAWDTQDALDMVDRMTRNAAVGTGELDAATDGAAEALLSEEEAAKRANDAMDYLVNNAMEPLTSEMLNQQIMASLTGDALLEYARKTGQIDSVAYDTLHALQSLTTEFDLNKDGLVDGIEATENYWKELHNLNAAEGDLEVAMAQLQEDFDKNKNGAIDSWEKTRAYRKELERINGMRAETRLDRYETTHITTVYGDEETLGKDWKFIGNQGTSAEGRSSGGPVMAGVPYLVGERGPEPFIPSTNGTIMPNSDFEKLLKNIKGGEININVYGAGDPWQTAHLIDLNFRAAQALAGVA